MAGITFYNHNGSPIAYCEDGTHIYLFNGKPVAHINKDSVYNYSGTHLGRLKNGWVLDNNGYRVFFTENATGGPVKPIKQIKPIKSVKQIKPLKGIKQLKPINPISSLSWSTDSSDRFFN